MYEELGDVVALQYGGSEAHAAMLAKLQGRSDMSSSVSDFRKTVRRAWANVFSDEEKQKAINLFLGKFRLSSMGPGILVPKIDNFHQIPVQTHPP